MGLVFRHWAIMAQVSSITASKVGVGLYIRVYRLQQLKSSFLIVDNAS